LLTCDIVIIGGGIAGLWTLNRLRAQGYHAILLEKNALGAGQTIASQGIIHGGIKYALTGELSKSSVEISDMPAIWQACLNGKGEIDLSAVNILSKHYYLCSQQKITQRITQFFAQKALHSDSEALDKTQYPDFFQNKQFTGLLTQVHECVLDVPSLIASLAKNMMPYIFKANDCVLVKDHDHYSVKIDNITLNPKHIILTAGEGNAQLLPEVAMQTRPLQMVILKADNLPNLYVHCVGLSANPVLTITSHRGHDGKTIWYLGGQLAEEGVHRDKDAQIHAAQELIQKQFPWFTLENPQWDTLFINRAEGFNHGKRPESVMVNTLDNVIVAWPTKLTFAPLLADEICKRLSAPNDINENLLIDLAKPNIANTVW
jgi:glycerol-3-phosphate dehydrogenase